MADKRLFTATGLVPLLRERGVDLSASQVHRLVSGTPELSRTDPRGVQHPAPLASRRSPAGTPHLIRKLTSHRVTGVGMVPLADGLLGHRTTCRSDQIVSRCDGRLTASGQDIVISYIPQGERG
jgi:hypothetical protein